MEITETTESMGCAPWSRVEIAGVGFDLVDAGAVLETICQWKREGRREYISLVNPHATMLCRRDPAMRVAIEKSALNLPDGMGVVLGASLLSYPHRGRLAGPEMMLFVCDKGRSRGLTHYFFGGADGIAEKLADRLCRQYPGLKVIGTSAPPFRQLSEEEDARCVESINARRPDVVWVGLGAPKQEKWMADHLGKIQAPAMVGIGAAFDFHSGNKPWCPALIRHLGLEWAFRLLCEPRRLWRRNLDSPMFLTAVARQLLTKKAGKCVPAKK